MILFINDPGSEFRNDITELIKNGKAKQINLKCEGSQTKDDVKNILNKEVQNNKESVSLIIYHINISGGSDQSGVKNAVSSIKEWRNVPLLTISAGGGVLLGLAEEGGSDATCSINVFYNKWKSCNGEENALIRWIKESSIELKKNRAIRNILALFLPIDIDMQALKVINEDKRNEYLTNESNGMLRDENVIYEKLLKKTLDILDGIHINNKNTVEKLLGIGNRSKIKEFFILLDTRKQTVKNFGSLTGNEIDGIINHFSTDGGWEVEGAKPEIIKSFHDWYCALAECLNR